MFPPRRQGIEPQGEPEKVIRAREIDERREAKQNKIEAEAVIAVSGINDSFSPIDNALLVSSDGGSSVYGSDGDAGDNDRPHGRRVRQR